MRRKLALVLLWSVAAAGAGGCGTVRSNLPVGDLDCEDVGKEIRVGSHDPYGLDADGDGIGCEGW